MEPVDQRKVTENTEGVYEALSIISRRARQVNDEIKAAISREIGVVPKPETDDGEEKEFNYERIRISKSFDKLDPVTMSVKEKLDGELSFRYREEE